ncbi:thioredoxin family protein [Eudoraea sp.]|uniref:thioredoxin family protein n=1 Tax=Eudoraea sp. TaxID=1979955 RepID=UPI003C72D1E7
MILHDYEEMKNTEDLILQEKLVESALSRAYTYEDYRNLLDELTALKRTTGVEQKESLINYTLLNNQRIRRWDKTLKLSDTAKKRIEKWKKPVLWLVLTESWCGDAAPAMPVMNKIAESSAKITFKVALRDENPELMDLFRTNGTLSIPKLLMVDEQRMEVMNSWGPRPTKATKMVEVYKKENGELTPEFKQDLQLWYNKDKGENILDDLLGLLTLK